MPRQPEPRRRAEQPGGRVDADVGDHVVPEARLVVGADAVVDRVTDEVPADDGRGGRDRGEQHHDGDAPVAPLRVAPEAGEPGPMLALTRQEPRLRTAARTAPPRPSSCAGAPSSTITPPSSTTARSATRIVERRWLETSTVRPATAGRRFCDEVALRLGVDRRHRVVEHEHARTCDERAREGDALALAAGEVDASLADQRVVAVWELLGEARHTRGFTGREHLVPARLGARGEQVVAQEHREEDGPLRDESDRAAELRQR